MSGLYNLQTSIAVQCWECQSAGVIRLYFPFAEPLGLAAPHARIDDVNTFKYAGVSSEPRQTGGTSHGEKDLPRPQSITATASGDVTVTACKRFKSRHELFFQKVDHDTKDHQLSQKALACATPSCFLCTVKAQVVEMCKGEVGALREHV